MIAENVQDILNGGFIKVGKQLLAHIECPCCGAEYFADPENGVIYSRVFRDQDNRIVDRDYLWKGDCECCSYQVKDCELVEEGEVLERYKNYEYHD